MQTPVTKPIVILSGFLGSGKTTFINRFLKENHGLKLAILVNELGEIGLDSSLIQGPGDFIKMDNGCLCCTLNANLLESLNVLKNREDFEAVLVETTGIADPLTIAWTFLRPQLEGRFAIAALVTLVDCLNADVLIPAHLEAREQISRADVICLTKTDLCSPEQVASVQKKVLELNSQVRFYSPDSLEWLALVLGQQEKITTHLDLPSFLHGQGHDFSSVSVDLKDKSIALNTMEDVFAQLPKQVLRAKAVFKDQETTYCMQSVCGRCDFILLENYEGPYTLILIGKGIPPKELVALCPEF